MKVIVSKEIKEVCPAFVGACLQANVCNTPCSHSLWHEIEKFSQQFSQQYTPETIKDRSPIAATRQVYRICGKDPSRYRPAAEALLRRVLQGKELYRVNTLVDLINLSSMMYGYSIGGFDASQFFGPEEEAKAIEFIKSERDRWQEYSITKLMDAIIDF